MFLPFRLRTAPQIFNLFAEALHWVFETLFEWNCTHYLDNFLLIFPPGTDIASISSDFDHVLAKFGLSKAAEKDSNSCVVIHLGFEFTPRRCKYDSLNLKSNELSTPSTLYWPHPVSYSQTSYPPSGSYLIVAKSFHLAVHSSATFSPCFADIVVVPPRSACHPTLATISDGGTAFLSPGRPSQ
jgi:hypothetical protein